MNQAVTHDPVFAGLPKRERREQTRTYNPTAKPRPQMFIRTFAGRAVIGGDALTPQAKP
jgi:hypothetical protein